MLRKIVLETLFVLAVITFFGALYLFSITEVSAQTVSARGKSDAPLRPLGLDELLAALQLTPQQTTTVQNTIDTERVAMRALDEALRPQRDAIVEATRNKLAVALTSAQMQRFDDWRSANRPPRPDGVRGRQSESPVTTRRSQNQ
ncbi:MAG: hypothetical protein LH481_03980 [Burkholderiales bacterium]|nr:hypothetical protein [Burkholderiales bacterium]